MKSKIKIWLQKKIRSLNTETSRDLADQFLYICRTEHFNNSAVASCISGVSDTQHCSSEIIVSLTTFGRRLYEVYLAIESIMHQTVKPNRIVLWLADEMQTINLPQVLLNQQKRGLEIRFCKDTKSYKKLIPALKEFPSSTIITIDDDTLYPFDFLENIISAHRENPKIILGSRIHRKELLGKNRLQKYQKWEHSYDSMEASHLNFPLGMGGVLYPPHCFNEEVFNESVFSTICEFADDVWFKAMALLNGVKAQKVFTHNKNGADQIRTKFSQYTSLSQINLGMNMNDKQLKAVFDKYDLYGKLRAET